MNAKSNQLFNQIINCPLLTKSGHTPCSSIQSIQSGNNRRQVPEPWSGKIETSSFLIIAANPALDSDEVFPSKDPSWGNWIDMGDGKTLWTDKDAEAYFEGRFGNAVCPAVNLPYFDSIKKTVLSNTSIGISEQKVQNSYWQTYNEYCRAIDENFKDYDYVVTDIVHCKGPKGLGTNLAAPICSRFTKQIVELFANNESSMHSILIFGKSNFSKYFLQTLGTGDSSSIGHYKYKRTGKRNEIYKSTIKISGRDVDVYYFIPAPSGSSRGCCPVDFLTKPIDW